MNSPTNQDVITATISTQTAIAPFINLFPGISLVLSKIAKYAMLVIILLNEINKCVCANHFP